VHGAGLDHSLFGLQSRYFGYHGWNVLALAFLATGVPRDRRFRPLKEWRTGS